MEAFGTLNVAWQWLQQGIVADKALGNPEIQGEDRLFYQSKIETMRFYFHYELPRTQGLFSRLLDTTRLTLFNAEAEALI
jgi:butyryl-CoA dehydrogenase